MAAGLGFKTFVTGEVLTSADTNGYLMQGVNVFADAAARTAAITSPQEGQMSFLKDTNSTEYYDGSAWVAVGASSPTSFTLLNAGGTALTGAATVTISGISNQQKLWVYVTGASSTVGGQYVSVRINTDTGTNYYTNGVATLLGTKAIFEVNGLTSNIIFGANDNAADTLNGSILIDGCKGSGVKVFELTGRGTNIWYTTKGYWDGSASVTSISIVSISSGNLDAGTVYVYGSGN
jgi:hypothetical protein